MLKINKEKLKQFKKAGIKLVLAATIAGTIVTASKMTADAIVGYEDNDLNSYYEIADDHSFAYFECYDTIDMVNNLKGLKEVTINSSTVNKPITNNSLTKIVFDSCEFCNNFSIPNTVKEITFKNTMPKNFDNMFSTIENLTIENCKFDNLDFIKNNSNIKNLSLNYCSTGSISALKSINHLNNLSLCGTKIESLEDIKHFKNLCNLDISNTAITSIKDLSGMNINVLDVSNDYIKDLDYVMNIKGLNRLISSNCQMSYTKDLKNYLDENGIWNNIEDKDFTIQEDLIKLSNSIIKDDMTDQEKIYTIVNYAINNIKYDERVYDNQDLQFDQNQNALSYALYDKLGCCMNYTALIYNLLNYNNISCYEIDEYNHIYNYVKLGNTFYLVDATWLDDETIKDIRQENGYMEIVDDNNPSSEICYSLPQSLYNYIYNTNKNDTNTNTDTVKQSIENKQTIENIKETLKKCKVPLEITIGIAMSFGAASIVNKKVKEKKKEIDKTNSKLK